MLLKYIGQRQEGGIHKNQLLALHRQGAQRWHQKPQFSNPVMFEQEFNQIAAWPASTRQLLIQVIKAAGYPVAVGRGRAHLVSPPQRRMDLNQIFSMHSAGLGLGIFHHAIPPLGIIY